MTFIVADRVRDTTTTTGTGALAIAANPPATYRTFSAVCSVNDTLPYFIAHQTADEWEVGIGTYSASNQLTRTTVFSSSNSNAAVSFSSGTKDVVLSVPATNAFGRERIFADRTYYVRSDGSDSNTGRANSAAGAKLTIGGAMAAINRLDFGGYVVTLQLQNATYNESIVIFSNYSDPAYNAWIGEGNLIIDGGGGTIAGNGSDASIAIYGGLPAGSNSTLTAQNGTLTNSAVGCIEIDGAGNVIIGASITLGSTNANSSKIYATNMGNIFATSNFTISGNSKYFGLCESYGQIGIGGVTTTVSGTPAFTAFYRAAYFGLVRAPGMTFSGSATGKRYEAETNAIIDTAGGGANYFPGDAAGTTATQGQYL